MTAPNNPTSRTPGPPGYSSTAMVTAPPTLPVVALQHSEAPTAGDGAQATESKKNGDRDARAEHGAGIASNPPAHQERAHEERAHDSRAGDRPPAQGQAHAPDEENTHFDAPPTRVGWLLAIALVIVGICVALFLIGFIPREKQEKQLEQQAEVQKNALPRVDVAYAQPSKKSFVYALPGTVQAFQETAIYARTNGYLKALYHDIGDRVPADAALALIDTPEIDEQVQQAKATLDQARADQAKAQSDVDLARTTLKRYKDIISTGGVTQQQIDERQSALDTANSNYLSTVARVAADAADLKRLTDIQSFQKITAPFGGTITARNVDVGALITPGGSAGGQPLFDIAETDKVRVFVSVPQAFVNSVRPGANAELTAREYPGHSFVGQIVRTAGALDMASRTLLTEIDVPNKDFALMPEMYVEVRLHIVQAHAPLIIPTSAMVFNASGTHVAVVERGAKPTTMPAGADKPEPADGAIHFQKVAVGRDFGTSMEILDGLSADQIVVSNPGEALVEGVGVKLIKDPGPPPPPTAVAEVGDEEAATQPASDLPLIVMPTTLPWSESRLTNSPAEETASTPTAIPGIVPPRTPRQ